MVNIGIIGAGRIGKVHGESISNYVKSAKIKAIADPFITEEIKEWAKINGIEKIYTDYKEILNDKEIDAVLICSSTDTHSSISIDAARAGKHIFCEKPIDKDISKIKKVLEEVKKSGVKYQVGFNRRFDENFKAIKEGVLAGKIGDVQLVKITSRDPELPPLEYVKVSGGMFMDMTIHDFDMARFLAGSEIIEVYAIGDALIEPKMKEADDIDTAVITLKFENGAMGVIDNSRVAAYGYDQRAEVFGNKGSLVIENNTKSTAVLWNKDGVIAEKPLYFFLERYMQSFADEIKQFIEAIINNTPTPVIAEDGLKLVLVAVAAKKSLLEGRPVKISEIE